MTLPNYALIRSQLARDCDELKETRKGDFAAAIRVTQFAKVELDNSGTEYSPIHLAKLAWHIASALEAFVKEYGPVPSAQCHPEVGGRGKEAMTPTGQVLHLVALERRRQEELKAKGRFAYTCADQGLSNGAKMLIIVEEVGEVARASQEGNLQHLREELIQVAAVAVAWAEALDEP